MGGPLWSGPLHNDDFVAAMEADAAVGAYGTYARMQGMLAVVREELPDTPLFYVLPDLLRTVRSSNLTFLQFRCDLSRNVTLLPLSLTHTSIIFFSL